MYRSLFLDHIPGDKQENGVHWAVGVRYRFSPVFVCVKRTPTCSKITCVMSNAASRPRRGSLHDRAQNGAFTLVKQTVLWEELKHKEPECRNEIPPTHCCCCVRLSSSDFMSHLKAAVRILSSVLFQTVPAFCTLLAALFEMTSKYILIEEQQFIIVGIWRRGKIYFIFLIESRFLLFYSWTCERMLNLTWLFQSFTLKWVNSS